MSPSRKTSSPPPEEKSATVTPTITLELDAITPYWRNPRRISEEAVATLVSSITEFGFQQPIVVDASHVIIVGHTRYAALRRLGHTTSEVIVASHLTPQQVKEYRLIDNKVAEGTSWDYEKLVTELTNIDSLLVPQAFDDVLSGLTPQADTGPVDTPSTPPLVIEPAEFTCPACYHTWSQAISKAEIAAGRVAPLALAAATS